MSTRRKITFNKRITLLALKPSPGRGEPTETARAIVWADVSDVGVTTKFSALQAGAEVSFSVIMWRKEFKDYTHCDFDGIRYKIIETGAAANPLHIRLLLNRG
ncbi:MAG: hypothetical protein HDT42_06255 [Ruminococcaceae bacterium]|nr:hypothetical protein [Oscillospiraceae bacterium]